MKRLLSAGLSFSLALALTAPGRLLAEDPEKDPDQIGNRNVGKGVNFYSLEKEIALGKQLASEVERQAKIINDPVIAEYVNRVGQNLVRNSDAKVPFTIKVIDSEEVNAFALPGGFFFVNSGLILKADNEAELAGVMAHEIAHVAARHGTRQATRGEIAQFGHDPADLHGRLDRLWNLSGSERPGADRLPAIFAAHGVRSGPAGLGVHVQNRIRSNRVRGLLRKDRDAGKAEARHHGQGILHAPADRRPHSRRPRRTFRNI